MRNMYQGKCFICNKSVKEGEGHFQAVAGMNKQQRKTYTGKKWLLRCKDCVGKKILTN